MRDESLENDLQEYIEQYAMTSDKTELEKQRHYLIHRSLQEIKRLEEENKKLYTKIGEAYSDIEDLENTNHRLRRLKEVLEEWRNVLEFYAAEENWKGILSGESAVLADGGERAKKALGVKVDGHSV